MPLNQLFKKYTDNYKAKPSAAVGLSIYGCSEREAEQFRLFLSNNNLSVSMLSVSKIIKRKRLPIFLIKRAEHIILFQDSRIMELRSVGRLLFNKLLKPALDKQIPVSLFSIFEEKGYHYEIDPQLLHKTPSQIEAVLALDQMIQLLSRRNFSATAREIHNRGFTDLQKTNLVNKFDTRAESSDIDHYPLDSDLDANQVKAVQLEEGAFCILAPAGSGKTKVLINRIVKLLNTGVSAEKVLALAFNRKAAEEMRQRLIAKGILVTNNLTDRGVKVTTLHGLGHQIIQNGLGWNFYEDKAHQEMYHLTNMAVSKFETIKPSGLDDPLQSYIYWIRKIKNELLNPETIDKKRLPSGHISKIFKTYLRLQHEHRFYNYDDMIYLAIYLLLQNGALRQKIQEAFDFVHIDELQDLNAAQIQFIKILSKPLENIYAVGDDDQMIYSWRGALSENVLQFDRHFPEAKQHILNTNYRSSSNIVQHSARLIKHNTNRIDKRIGARCGATPGILQLETESSLLEQARKAAEWIRKLRERDHYNWRDFAVLYRFHAYKFVLTRALQEASIPVSFADEHLIFQTHIGQDIFAYLTVLLRPEITTPRVMRRFLKHPERFIKNKIIDQILSPADIKDALELEAISEKEKKTLARLQKNITELISQIRKDNPQPARCIVDLCNRFGLVKFYKALGSIVEEPDQATELVNLEVILNIAQQFRSIDDFYMYMRKNLTLAESEQPDKPKQMTDEVILTTIHSTKGNQYSNVVYFNLSARNLPKDAAKLEEERRVCYVAVTRAIDNLLITAPSKNFAPFLSEFMLSDDLSNISFKRLSALLNDQREDYKKIKNRTARIKNRLQKLNEQHALVKNELMIHIPDKAPEMLKRKNKKLSDEISNQADILDNLQNRKLPEIQNAIARMEQELALREILNN